MPLDFPNLPAVNDTWTASNGVVYVWDGTKWAVSGGGAVGTAYLPLSGGTMTGPIALAADPATSPQAANKHYVDQSINLAGNYLGTWSVAANTPNISGGGAISNANYVAVTVNPATPETAPVGVPGIAGMTVANGDRIIWAAGLGVWQILRNAGVTLSAADARYYAITNPSGYQTAAQVAAAVPVASSTLPNMDSAAAVGTGTAWARSDHVHPVDTSRYAASNPSGYQTSAQVVSAIAGGNPGTFSTLSAQSTAYFMTGMTASFAINGDGTYLYFQWSGGWYWSWNRSNGSMAFIGAYGTGLVLANDRSFSVYSTALKPGGGLWTDNSDVRLKQNVEEYRAGLAEVRALRPVTYQFNGLGETEQNGKRYHGLIAQEAGSVMPEMVGARRGRLRVEDSEETDILTVDATPLIYALVNAAQELAARVAALENKELR